MKYAILFLLSVFGFNVLDAQQIPFNYSIRLQAKTIANLPGIHSYAVAQANGKWLIIGGRKDGLHARQPMNSFPATNNNTDLYVIDIATQQFWTASVNSLATGLKEQLQSTNMNFFQDGDSLYIIGGYGYSATAADHITFPNLTSVSVSGLISAIVASTNIAPYFKQISDQNFAVNGGHLAKIDDTFYLVGGHRFMGRYNPMGNPTYTQTYVDGIRKFKLNNSGSQLSFSNYTVVTDQVHLHRRDYNLVPQIFPNGDHGYMISSGVFQVGIDLPFLYPVTIAASGYTPQTSFSQYLSNYHSANTSIYDSVTNTMHALFFGGMSQYSYVNNVLTQDNAVPFVKTISRVSRDANGNLQEAAFATEMPGLIGASAEFIVNRSLPRYENEVLKLSQVSSDSILLGHIFGGIFSPQTNPFSVNNTVVTNAHPTIYEVWMIKNTITHVQVVNGANPLQISAFPNPSKKLVGFTISAPKAGNLHVYVTDMAGKIILEDNYDLVKSGPEELTIKLPEQLSAGLYSFNFVFDGKYSSIERVLIKE